MAATRVGPPRRGRADRPRVDQPQTAARCSPVLRSLLENRLFGALLIGGVALRAIVSVAYQPALPLPHDAEMYVERALTMSLSGSFHPFLYPILLKPFIIIGDLGWVTLAQHLAGVAMAVMLFAVMRRLGVHPVAASLGVVPVLFDGFQVNIEHHILSETFFQLFIVAALVVLVWSERPSVVAAGIVGVMIAMSALTRFPGLAVIIPIVAYSLLRRLGWVRIGVLLASFLLPLAAYAVWFGSENGSVGITNRNGFFLYGRVVQFADCGEVEVPARLRVFCPDGRRVGSGIKGLFTSGLPDDVRLDESNNAAALDFSVSMIKAKPSAYASAVLADFLTYFSPAKPETREASADKWLFKEKYGDRLLEERVPGGERTYSIVPRLASLLHDYQSAIWTYGPLLASMLVLGIAGGILGWMAERRRSLAPEAWLFTLSAVGLLLFPPVFAVYHVRYVLPAIPLVGVAAALGATCLSARPHRRGERSPA